MYRVLLATLVAAVTAVPVRAQMPNESAGYAMEGQDHVRAFTNGDPSGWTLGAPHLDVAGGLYHVDRADGATLDDNAAFVRAHLQLAIGAPFIQVSSDIQFVPKFTKAEPTVSAVFQVAPVAQSSALYLSGGIGAITGHTASGALAGWIQAQAAIRTPLHAVTLFGQVGRALNDGARTELLIGLQHPLSPYKLHPGLGS